MPATARRQHMHNALSLARRLELLAQQIKTDLATDRPGVPHAKQAKEIADDLHSELRDIATIDEMLAKLKGRAA